jgi:hypothetical protein
MERKVHGLPVILETAVITAALGELGERTGSQVLYERDKALPHPSLNRMRRRPIMPKQGQFEARHADGRIEDLQPLPFLVDDARRHDRDHVGVRDDPGDDKEARCR